MAFAAISFWLIGFTSAYGLAFPAGLGAIGIWIGFSIAVGTFATLLVWRFHSLTGRGYLPSVIGSDSASPAADGLRAQTATVAGPRSDHR
jgi:multidrug resistance protein, MATE family